MIHQLLAHDPVAQSWAFDTRDAYLAFSQRLMKSTPLEIKIGKGGLSYYKAVKNGSVFVCHFNAMPQRQRNDLGFADFRFDALRPYLDPDETVQAMQKAAPSDIQIKVNKLWCSLHFPLTRLKDVTDLFSEHIIAKVK